jgi:predicted ester cyclase
MSMPLLHKALVAQFLTELFERRSDEPLQHLITSDFRLHGAGATSALRGVAALQPTLASLRADFANTRVRVQDLFAEGDRVAARYVFEAEQAGASLPGSPRRRIELPGMLVARIERGRVAECWHHEGGLEMAVAGSARSDAIDAR